MYYFGRETYIANQRPADERNLLARKCVRTQLARDTCVMDANAAHVEPWPVFGSEPDPDRPSIPAAAAAKYYKKSRFYVTELIKQGEIQGFGVQKDESGRIRWYVYEDDLPHEQHMEDDGTSIRMQELLRHVLDARDHARDGRAARGLAHEALVDVVAILNDAVLAASNGEMSLVNKLFREVIVKQGEEMRKQQEAQNFETKAEACLDKALRSIFPTLDDSEQQSLGEATPASTPAVST
jgi:hypothetical protein